MTKPLSLAALFLGLACTGKDDRADRVADEADAGTDTDTDTDTTQTEVIDEQN